jgi:hypothetical protein
VREVTMVVVVVVIDKVTQQKSTVLLCGMMTMMMMFMMKVRMKSYGNDGDEDKRLLFLCGVVMIMIR